MEFALVQVFEDGIEISHSMVVILLLIEDATDVVNRQGTLLQVFITSHGVSPLLKNEQVVIECLETLFCELTAIGTILANEEKELDITVDCKVLTVDDGFSLRNLVFITSWSAANIVLLLKFVNLVLLLLLR